MLNHETLEERLHEDLGRVQPGSAPLAALISQGKAIRVRRRARLAAGLAAVAVLGAGAPVVLSGGGSSPVSATGHETVLASGTIDGKQWTFTTSDPREPGPTGCAGYVSGRWGNSSSGACLGQMPAATDPVFLTGGTVDGAASLFTAQLRPDVDHVTITATGGAVLTPTIAEVSGRRYAFFALPPKQGIARLDAVGAGGKAIAYTIPYYAQDTGLSLVESWYPAGTTPTQAAVKQTLFSGTTSSSEPVTVSVDLGPFGVCYLLSAPGGPTGYGPDCHSVTPPPATALALRDYAYGDRELLLTEVNSAVDYVEVTLSDTTTARLTPVRIGGHSFVVKLLDPGVKLRVAKAYDASGRQLAAGTP